MRKDAAHAVDVQFAEAEAFGLAFDRDSGGEQFGHQEWIAFLDHDAAFDRGGEVADRLHRQRVGETQLQD